MMCVFDPPIKLHLIARIFKESLKPQQFNNLIGYTYAFVQNTSSVKNRIYICISGGYYAHGIISDFISRIFIEH